MIFGETGCDWCVYIHISPSNKIYIGITSQPPKRRWRNGDGYKRNQHFYNAIKKYGWDSFQHEIIASNLTEDDAKNFESLLIEKLQSNNYMYGYNRSSGGDAARHCEETKQLLREIRGASVCQFDLDMNFIEEYPSAKQAGRCTGIWESMILGCCNRSVGYKTAGGYVWLFKDDLQRTDFDEYKRCLKHEKLPKPVCKFTLDMVFLNEYPSIAEASKQNRIPSPDISNAISGKSKSSGGYIWIAKDDYDRMLSGEIELRKPFKNSCYKEVYQFSLDMDLINKYSSRASASKAINVTPQAIGYACRSKTHMCHNYIWWYKDDYERMIADESA